MLTALAEPGHGDDTGKCNNKDDVGGTATRFYFLICRNQILCFLLFRNQIPGFLIFRNQILTAEIETNMNAILRAWDPSYKIPIEMPMKAFLEILGNKGKGTVFPHNMPVSGGWMGTPGLILGTPSKGQWMLPALDPGAWSSPSRNAADFGHSCLILEDILKEKAAPNKSTTLA